MNRNKENTTTMQVGLMADIALATSSLMTFAWSLCDVIRRNENIVLTLKLFTITAIKTIRFFLLRLWYFHVCLLELYSKV